MPEVKIATFNVNSLKARLPIVERFMSGDESPDIICFQETKCRDEEFPREFFSERGFHAVYSGMKSYNGVAVVARREPDAVEFGFLDGEDSEQDRARVARVRFGGLSILNCYVPQGKEMETPEFQYKLRFFARLRELLAKSYSQGEDLLWTGDLNVAPSDDDVTHPENKRRHVCVCQEAREALAAVVSWGLVDVFRKHRPGAGEFTFWDYRVKGALERNIGWRIDHLFATPSLAEKSTAVTVARELRSLERPSDHTAVVGVFELR